MVMVLPLNVAILQLRSWSPLRTWCSVAMTFQLALAAVVLFGTIGLTWNVLVQLMVWSQLRATNTVLSGIYENAVPFP